MKNLRKREKFLIVIVVAIFLFILLTPVVFKMLSTTTKVKMVKFEETIKIDKETYYSLRNTLTGTEEIQTSRSGFNSTGSLHYQHRGEIKTKNKVYYYDTVGEDLGRDNCIFEIIDGNKVLLDIPKNRECKRGEAWLRQLHIDVYASQDDTKIFIENVGVDESNYIIEDDGTLYEYK